MLLVQAVQQSGKCGIICPLSKYEPPVKYALGGIDIIFLSEYECYAKCELGNMV